MRFVLRKSNAALYLGLTLIVACYLTACSAAREAVEPAAIGVIVGTTGSPSVVRNNRSYILDIQSRIYEGDILKTNSASKVAIDMIDATRMMIGAESHFLFHRYDFDPNQQSPAARMTLSSGSFKVVTRFSDTARGKRFEIGTPVATINIKGGEAWGGLVFAANSLDVTLLKGRGLSVTNDHGSVAITKPGEGTTVVGGASPQLPVSWPKQKSDRAVAETAI